AVAALNATKPGRHLLPQCLQLGCPVLDLLECGLHVSPPLQVQKGGRLPQQSAAVVLGDSRALASWPPVGGGEGTVLLDAVVADRVDLDDPAGDRQLHGVADQADLDLLATVGPAGVVAGAGEGDRPARIRDPGDGPPGGGRPRWPGGRRSADGWSASP